MVKKKGKKKSKNKTFILLVILIVLVVLVTGSVFKDWIQIMDNKTEKVELMNKYSSLLEEEQKLKSDVNKLQDPDYVARYAREKYLYTKSGELIIRIPKNNDSE